MWFPLRTDHKLAANQQLSLLLHSGQALPLRLSLLGCSQDTAGKASVIKHKTAPFLCILLLSGSSLPGHSVDASLPPNLLLPLNCSLSSIGIMIATLSSRIKKTPLLSYFHSTLQAVSHSSSDFLYTDVVDLVSNCHRTPKLNAHSSPTPAN